MVFYPFPFFMFVPKTTKLNGIITQLPEKP